MADFQVSPGVKFRNVEPDSLAAGMLNREGSMVYLWDIGPPKPEPPRRPAVPKGGKEGEPEFDLAKLEFDIAMENYKTDLLSHAARKAEYATFERQWGGPHEEKMWSVDARDALERDARAVEEGRQAVKRWFMSARTRGYEKLPNGGLPSNMKPGPGHFDNLRREQEGDADMAAAKRSDPVFGNQEMQR